MRVIAQANNKNNSRVTVEYYGSGPLTNAEVVATMHDCKLSHNVTCKPSVKVPIANGLSFGTISFNKGNHAEALKMFIDLHTK